MGAALVTTRAKLSLFHSTLGFFGVAGPGPLGSTHVPSNQRGTRPGTAPVPLEGKPLDCPTAHRRTIGVPMTISPLPRPPRAHTPAYGDVDLTTCDREPIHIPGAIQPHGLLLALDPTSTRVVMASANAAALLPGAGESVLGRRLGELLDGDTADRILHSTQPGAPLTLAVPAAPTDRQGTLAGRTVNVAVHGSGGRLVVEIEPVAAGRELTFLSARSAMARLVGAATVPALAAQLAVEIRTVTGFDRVMVYRFDDEWNGEVVAEDRREDLNPFLGLHYPATDIPAQARRLYTENWIRLIADIGYVPVPLEPVLDPASGEPLDLSFSTLRSVSPIHVEYLSNMGVTASMSISLIVDGELWGLIACHHYSGPHRPDHEARAAAEFLGQMASQMMAERERGDQREQALAAQAVLAKLTSALTGAGDRLLEVLVDDPAALDVVRAEGVALCFDDQVTSCGRVPDEAVTRRVTALLRREDGEAAASHHLASLDPDLAAVADVAAGALVVGTAADRWMVWFRPELERTIDWGGDPHNAKLYSTEGPEVRLSPRKSFDKWREVVRGRSEPWTQWQHEMANSVRTQAAGLLLHRSREQIAVAESLQRSIADDLSTTVADLDISATYLPATEFPLGGDWWDHIELDDGRVVFVVGDVAGHGVAAVAAMTQIRTALRAYLFENDDPGEALDALDRLMAGLMADQVASAVIAVVDPGSGEVRFASAGHPAPILYGDGPARFLDVASRPLLGIGIGTAEVTAAQLPPGATLLLYTDGLFERRGHDIDATLGHLLEAGGDGPRGGSGQAWSDALVAAVPGAGDDDTTVLAIRRLTPPPGPAGA